MPIYYGKSKDGSDAKEFEGFYVSENGKYWATEPINNDGTLNSSKSNIKNQKGSKFHR